VINRTLKRARRGLIPDNRIIFLSHKKVSRAFPSLINEMPFINGNYHAALITEIFSRYLHPTKMQFVNSANLCVRACMCVRTCVCACTSCTYILPVRYVSSDICEDIREHVRTCANIRLTSSQPSHRCAYTLNSARDNYVPAYLITTRLSVPGEIFRA